VDYTHSTLKLPRLDRSKAASPVLDDNAYVQGTSAINYANLAKPESESESNPWIKIIIGGTILVVAMLGAAYYYFVVLHNSP
jgi:hypothetical protein